MSMITAKSSHLVAMQGASEAHTELYCNTVKEYWSWQRSRAPRAVAECPDPLDSRPLRCDTFGMVGVDEVGRGCLAGPILVVAARQIGPLPDGLRDSKLLSRRQRQSILERLTSNVEFGEGWVKAVEIDRYGLAKALRLGIKRALKSLKAQADEEIIMDGKVNYIPKKFRRAQCIIDADNLVPIVSAASIYAKVTRDNFMIELAKRHPSYKFENHVGYGTAEHRKAINSFGIIKFVHRTSYAPVSKLVAQAG